MKSKVAISGWLAVGYLSALLLLPAAEGAWTAWLDRDNPSGVGDFETLKDFIREKAPVCPRPIGINCRAKATGRDARLTGEIVICSKDVGLICINNRQRDRRCNFDYEVRFLCPSTPPPSGCWGPWLDRDNPSGTGDYETLRDFIREKAPVCPKPSGIRCRRKDNKIDASQSGETVVCRKDVGFYCVNRAQRDRRCNFDYEVSFQCPCS
eukprot:m.215603 g.215603  ORF g.215603 m.215603 type:complete len:209 (+) comp39836_c0_seq1:464-1090(+)